MDWLCKTMRGRFEIVAITNDIYTREDAEFLTRSGALPPERIRGVETGGCPHTAIREDASINLAAVAEMNRLFPQLDLVLIEFGRRQSRGDLLARTGRSDDLRHRRRGRRQDPAQGRPRHHPLRPPRHQQDRSGAAGRRQPRGHGPRRETHARRAALRLHQPQDRRGASTGSSISSSPRAGCEASAVDVETEGHPSGVAVLRLFLKRVIARPCTSRNRRSSAAHHLHGSVDGADASAADEGAA